MSTRGKLRSYYNYDTKAASMNSALVISDEDRRNSKVVQSQKEEADINTIVRRFGVTGQLPQNVRVPSFQDFEDSFDFQSAMNALRLAQESFMQMPADTRARFNNDPQRFIAFCEAKDADGNLANIEEMRKLGLAVPKKADIMAPSTDSSSLSSKEPVSANGNGSKDGDGDAASVAASPGKGSQKAG